MNTTEHERLATRVIDDPTCDTTWAEVCRTAGVQPGLWRLLAEAQRDEAGLACLGHVAGAAADATDFDDALAAARAQKRVDETTHRAAAIPARSRWANSAGWAVAAIVLLSWTVSAVRGPVAPPNPNGNSAQLLPTGVTPVRNADEALEAYMAKGREEGRVLKPMPNRVLRSAPDPSGGVRVIYIRQVMELATVQELVEARGTNEAGDTQFVPVDVKYFGDL